MQKPVTPIRSEPKLRSVPADARMSASTCSSWRAPSTSHSRTPRAPAAEEQVRGDGRVAFGGQPLAERRSCGLIPPPSWITTMPGQDHPIPEAEEVRQCDRRHRVDCGRSVRRAPRGAVDQAAGRALASAPKKEESQRTCRFGLRSFVVFDEQARTSGRAREEPTMAEYLILIYGDESAAK